MLKSLKLPRCRRPARAVVVVAGVGESAVERDSTLRSSPDARLRALHEQLRLLHTAVLSARPLPPRPALQHHSRTFHRHHDYYQCPISVGAIHRATVTYVTSFHVYAGWFSPPFRGQNSPKRLLL